MLFHVPIRTENAIKLFHAICLGSFCILTLLYCESLEMDSEGRIVEVVLGTDVSDYDRRTGDTKTRSKNWCSQFARKVGPSGNSVRYSSFRLWVSRSTRDREWTKASWVKVNWIEFQLILFNTNNNCMYGRVVVTVIEYLLFRPRVYGMSSRVN